MDNEKYRKVLSEVLDRTDFKSGIIQEISEDGQGEGYIIDVRWKRNLHFILKLTLWNSFWYYVERDGERVSPSYRVWKVDDKFFEVIQHLVNEIENGSFNFKKTEKEKIRELIRERQLTSYMNNTKWKEFIHVMNEEISIKIPYDYKNIFEENHKEFYSNHYDECFNCYNFNSIEWVKLKPKFCEYNHRGHLLADEEIYHDVEEEFISLMKKYSINCEYDEVEKRYTIYGYK